MALSDSDLDLIFVIDSKNLRVGTDLYLLQECESLLRSNANISGQEVIDCKVPLLRFNFRGHGSMIKVDMVCAKDSKPIETKKTHLLLMYSRFDSRLKYVGLHQFRLL